MRRGGKRLAAVLVATLAFLELAYEGLDRLFPLPEQGFQAYGASPEVLAADGTKMRVGLTDDDERRIPVPISEISPHLLHAVLASEDRRFYEHGGVDALAVLRATGADVLGSGPRQGASTITMQLARLVDPTPRTLPGKLVQAFRALQLEDHHDKRFLLEHYLNLVPFGGNLRGAGAAAYAFFGKRAADLSAAEAALLVSLLPAPTRLSPLRDPEGALVRRNRVLDEMAAQGWLDRSALAAAKADPLGIRPTSFPDVATHAWLHAESGRTSIDPTIQHAVEEVASDAGGPDGLAIVVVENESGAVRALVGAKAPRADVLDASDRPRSAGSTLKPFLYALAFDRGLALPETKLLDLPWQTSDWAPRDFDEAWRGPVPAGIALADSLNVPAVRLAASLPRGAFPAALRWAGFRHVRAPGEGTGVDLALGTDDVTAWELAGAYAALARGGLYLRPWLEAAGRPGADGLRRICSKGAAALVTQALADPTRGRPPGAPRSNVAWKTGTSSRRRDAWAAGYTKRYTAVVWCGRLDGRPDERLVGARAAAPLFFRVIEAVDRAPGPMDVSDGLEKVAVCAETGLLAGPACPKRIEAFRPEDARPLRPCPVHRRLAIDVDTGRLRCPRCETGHGVEERDVAIYEPVLLAWRKRVGLAEGDALPPHAEDCPAPREPEGLEPVFAEPPTGRTVRADESGEARVPFRILAAEGEEEADLLVDGRPEGRVPTGVRQTLLLAIGRHALEAVSPRGRTARIEVTVAAPDR